MISVLWVFGFFLCFALLWWSMYLAQKKHKGFFAITVLCIFVAGYALLGGVQETIVGIGSGLSLTEAVALYLLPLFFVGISITIGYVVCFRNNKTEGAREQDKGL